MQTIKDAEKTASGMSSLVTSSKAGKEHSTETDSAGDFMANEQNLKPFTSDQSHEEAVKNGQKGGIASGKARRARKTLRMELEEVLMKHPVNKETGEESKLTFQESITVALVKKALKGDSRAYEIIRDTIGEKPVDNIQISQPDFSALDNITFEEPEPPKAGFIK